MESKYYTPNLEDLRVGYICIERVSLPEWHMRALGTAEFIGTIGEKAHWENSGSLEGLVRTKYLDKKDIESLGWDLHKEEDLLGSYKGIFTKNWSNCPPDAQCYDHDYGTYVLTFHIYKNFTDICIRLEITKQGTGGGWGGPYEETLFKANNLCEVKSINELNFLMNLLNIQ